MDVNHSVSELVGFLRNHPEYLQVRDIFSFSPIHTQISLQFPDYLLKFSAEIVCHLQKEFGDDYRFNILADTSYGECCVDDVAASHVATDLIVHFGNSCLSKSSSFDLLFIFDFCSFDMDLLMSQLKSLLESAEITPLTKTVIIPDVEYYDFFHQNFSTLKSLFQTFERGVFGGQLAKFCPKPTNDAPSICTSNSLFGFSFEKLDQAALQSSNLLFIGKKSSKFLYKILLEFSPSYTTSKLFVFDTQTNALIKDPAASVLNTSRAFGKRLRLIEKVPKCDVFGILVGTFSIENCRQTIDRVKDLLKKAQKRFFTFVVGKVNVAKLANFLDVQMFVWVGCPSSDLVTEDACYSQFHAPIVTPLELMLGLSGDPFKFSYSTSLERFQGAFEDEKSELEPEESTSFVEDALSGAVQLKSKSDNRLNFESNVPSFGQMLSLKSYRGVPFEKSSSIGTELSYEIEEGKTGIASQYSDEHKHTHLF